MSEKVSNQRGEDPDHLLDRAFEYYVAGRFSALNQFKIAANLLHHAIEMILKFALLKDVPGERLAREFAKLKDPRRYGHNLINVWSLYKSTIGRLDLDRFDAVVSDLDRWEKLRYGGFPIGIATAMIFMPRRGPRAVKSSEPEDRYILVLEDVDDLFAAILEASNINPRFVGVRFHSRPAVLDWYSKENQHSTMSEPKPSKNA